MNRNAVLSFPAFFKILSLHVIQGIMNFHLKNYFLRDVPTLINSLKCTAFWS